MVQKGHGISTWSLSCVPHISSQSPRYRADRGCTGESLPSCQVWRIRRSRAVLSVLRRLALGVRLDLDLAFPEGQLGGASVRRSFPRRVRVVRPRCTSGWTSSRPQTIRSLGQVPVRGAQIQRRWSRRVVVPIHGHDPRNMDWGEGTRCGMIVRLFLVLKRGLNLFRIGLEGSLHPKWPKRVRKVPSRWNENGLRSDYRSGSFCLTFRWSVGIHWAETRIARCSEGSQQQPDADVRLSPLTLQVQSGAPPAPICFKWCGFPLKTKQYAVAAR